MDLELNTTVITAECLCKAHIFTTEIAQSKLPLECNVCHCNSCRHSTGALHVCKATWPQAREDVDMSSLNKYQFSANITYRFCGTCSTLMFYESQRYPSKLGVFTGTLRNIDADLIKLTKHIFVEDTLDGGASVWFRRPNPDGIEIPRFAQFAGDKAMSSQVTSSSSTEPESKQEQESLPLWCHCNGIQLKLHRGNYASKKREELPSFIDPRTNKPIVTFDVCDSCRLQFGQDIIHWTFVELANISQPDGGAFPKTIAELKTAVDAGDPAVGTLAYYESSPPHIQRYFCKRCSATVFYASDNRPQTVDLPIGLLEAADGARAEGFLSWNYGGTPTWVDDTKGGWREGLVKRVLADAEAFRISQDYPKGWKRVQQEAKEESS
ncbi:hypothetical protein B7463_g5656, partial [Scytalidium lignicola]